MRQQRHLHIQCLVSIAVRVDGTNQARALILIRLRKSQNARERVASFASACNQSVHFPRVIMNRLLPPMSGTLS
jgi:hypothetical protein